MSIDAEWAIDKLDDKLYIIQARPETIHSNKNNSKIKSMTIYNMINNNTEIIFHAVVGNKISTGNIKILNSIHDHELFNKGDILVTDITTPDWEPLMSISSGIINKQRR